jgi:hypothetical protein
MSGLGGQHWLKSGKKKIEDRKRELEKKERKAELSTDINEFYLFHGTSSKTARFICEHGFDERVANHIHHLKLNY